MQKRNQKPNKMGQYPRIISNICQRVTIDRSVCAELKGRNEIVIRGCRRIDKYTPQKITLKIKCGSINVCGNDLTCFAFSEADVGIQGEIKCIFFTGKYPKGGESN